MCPVDCILLENVTATTTGWSAWPQALADEARTRYSARQNRRAREETEHAQRQQQKAEMKLADLPAHSQHTDPVVLDQKRAVIEAALARARARAKPGGAG